jgi:uncharacterized coiled-coil protein SlyX
MGLLIVPNLSAAGSSSRDGDERHSLLNAQLRSKIEHLRDKIQDHRERHHDNEGASGSITALQSEIANLKTALATANGQLSALNERLKALETGGGGGSTNPVLTELAKYVKVEMGTLNEVKGPHVVFTGVNLHVRSGRNATNDGGTLSGLGNLIVGYNETQSAPVVYDGAGCDRVLTGSHNIVMGTGNFFTSYGGIVVGSNHCVTSPNSSILAGDTNEAHGLNSAILGGNRRGTSTQNQTVPVIR